ncbi:MAG: phosphoribosylamine--glycine ligase [Deltaproteobacteria bacterium]|nr:phosphoribosylamine--glycine ligase [Deltaproteobacteria bacterium]MCL5791946.1 phosphoribosylamine--glycine ligase [Deltaproteobacteria bacterium]
MNILVVGSGAREHAIVHKLKQDGIKNIYCAPGNAGIDELATCVQINHDDINGLINFAKEQHISLTIVGPEISLSLGIVDAFNENDLTIFGPTKQAAMIESSKFFARQIMHNYHIPQPGFEMFDNSNEAIDYVKTISYPAVIKADGLAAGKGVSIVNTREEAIAVVKAMMEQRIFGDAGKKILVEEFLNGVESSYFVISNGKGFVKLGSARDYKRLNDMDKGPNTGGMGSISPSDKITPAMEKKVIDKIITPLMDAFKQESIVYKGVIYTGLMIVDNEPYVLEFNARFGDPETQAIIPRIISDLSSILVDSAKGKTFTETIKTKEEVSVCVVMASKNYPEHPETGKIINGLRDAVKKDTFIFHAGTKKEKGSIITTGGRVLAITGIGTDYESAREKAYRSIGNIVFEGANYRKDIGL